jgi:hypothetical protein
MLPKVFNYTLNISTTMASSISRRKIDKWNFTVNSQQTMTLDISLVKNQALKNMNKPMVVSVMRTINNNVSTVSTFNLTKSTNKYNNNNLVLDSGSYFIQVSCINTSLVNYNLKLSTVVINDVIIDNNSEIKKYALIVTISDYLYINDLSYCDEDAIAWYSFLKTNGYEVYLLGDKSSTYGQYTLNDYATEANIRKYMTQIVSTIKANDQFVFVSSGHGSGDGRGNSYLCCLDLNSGPNGAYTDKELASDVKLFTDKRAKVILFFDNCFSGGLIPEVVGENPTLVCATSTCSQNGYGYDVDQYKQGAWTYHFLILTLQSNSTATINDTFTKALMKYPFKQGDTPQLGGNGSLKF